MTKQTTGKHPGGRPSKYDPEYCTAIIDYFKDETIQPLPLFEDFAEKLDICVTTLYVWQTAHPEFLKAYKRAQKIQLSRWIKGSMEGKFNTAFTIFAGKNMFGWRDKNELEIPGLSDLLSAMPTAVRAEIAKALKERAKK